MVNMQPKASVSLEIQNTNLNFFKGQNIFATDITTTHGPSVILKSGQDQGKQFDNFFPI